MDQMVSFQMAVPMERFSRASLALSEHETDVDPVGCAPDSAQPIEELVRPCRPLVLRLVAGSKQLLRITMARVRSSTRRLQVSTAIRLIQRANSRSKQERPGLLPGLFN